MEFGGRRSQRQHDTLRSKLSRVMRKHEADHFSGMAYYMLGVTATCAFFHETIAVIGKLALPSVFAMSRSALIKLGVLPRDATPRIFPPNGADLDSGSGFGVWR